MPLWCVLHGYFGVLMNGVHEKILNGPMNVNGNIWTLSLDATKEEKYY